MNQHTEHPAQEPAPTAALDRAPSCPVSAVLALGANLGDAAAALDGAVRSLDGAEGLTVTGASPRAVTAAVGGPAGQPDYLNQVLTVVTTLSPWALLRVCHEVEQAHHRVREARWGPRTLDVDLITYEAVVSDHPDLTLPHPRAHQRAFVLAPWSWLAPDARLADRPVAELAAEAADAGTVRHEDAVAPSGEPPSQISRKVRE